MKAVSDPGPGAVPRGHRDAGARAGPSPEVTSAGIMTTLMAVGIGQPVVALFRERRMA